MREKNELLVELLEKTKEELAAERKNTKNKSYTEALKNTDKVKELDTCLISLSNLKRI